MGSALTLKVFDCIDNIACATQVSLVIVTALIYRFTWIFQSFVYNSLIPFLITLFGPFPISAFPCAWTGTWDLPKGSDVLSNLLGRDIKSAHGGYLPHSGFSYRPCVSIHGRPCSLDVGFLDFSAGSKGWNQPSPASPSPDTKPNGNSTKPHENGTVHWVPLYL